MSHVGDVGSWMSVLPPDVLCEIFSHCDTKSLGVLAQVCTRFYSIVNQDCLWVKRARRVLATNQVTDDIKNRSCRRLSARDKCRVSYNWRKALYREDYAISHRTRYMPWLQLSSNRLWCSKGNVIQCFRRYSSGFLQHDPCYILKGHIEDVCRFVRRSGLIVSGGRDGTVCGWDDESGQFLFCKRRCHRSDVNCVDVNTNIVVSGSKDTTVQVWSLQNKNLLSNLTVNAQDRVWSVAINPSTTCFAVGTAGCQNVLPLQLYDLQTGRAIKILGSNYRNGAGILDMCYETPFLLLSAGYDTYIRMWDTRTETCVLEWEDPHDSAVYCLSTDQNLTVVSGTIRYGLVRLWDKRCTKSVQMYYVGRERGNNSPVYSIAFDPCQMFVALDHSLNLLDFSGYNLRNYNLRNCNWH